MVPFNGSIMVPFMVSMMVCEWFPPSVPFHHGAVWGSTMVFCSRFFHSESSPPLTGEKKTMGTHALSSKYRSLNLCRVRMA